MKNNTTLVILCLFSGLLAQVFWVGSAHAAPAKDIDSLLKRVMEQQKSDAVINQQRIAEFARARDQQQALLTQAQQVVAQREATSAQLKQQIESNDDELLNINAEIDKALGNFGELFGVTRQVAGEARAQINQSIISAQFPHRDDLLTEIAQGKELPTIDELKGLWFLLLQEQTEQGKVARFNTTIHDQGGKEVAAEVTRLGVFAAVANGEFLVFDESVQRLKALGRQPASVYRRSASRIDTAAPGELVTATIDPSSGTILSLLVQAPNLMERFHQGGLVGYIVSVLAVIGIAMGLQRIVSLWWTSAKVNRQARSRKTLTNNPLGRILKTYEDNPTVDVETLGLKLEDAVYKEVPKLEKGLNTLKVLAAIAPLMGLLGTVIGMILTFQTITLWGAGDPKLMASGISQALMTTVQGLVAAIPLLLLHSFASGRARMLQQVLQEQCAGLVAKRAENKVAGVAHA